MILLILVLIFFSAAVLTYGLSPVLIKGANTVSQQQAQRLTSKADLYLQDTELKRAHMLTMMMPIVLGVCGFIFFQENLRLAGTVAGVVVGAILPRMYVGGLIGKRKKKFTDQLVDALMIMSSSFRGGLSLVQAVEAVVDEMPEPIKGEFGVVLGENKMGVSLEESLYRLYDRMPSIALQQMITAILLARETGGNLPVIFSRIVSTIRERRKIEQNMETLTIQGKIQAVVMTGLPIFFVFGVSASNPKFFDIMFKDEMGRQMLMACGFLWVVGAFFILKNIKLNDL
jgi:tight adherence protein B